VDKVLITGGAGFMGWHLGAHLAERGYAVDLVDNLTRGVNDADLRDLVSRPDVRLLEVDLTQPDAMAGADTDYTFIVHFAAVVGVARVVEQPFGVLRDNWAMLSNVLNFARRQRSLQRFLFPSTSEAYAGTLEHFELPVPTPESAPITVPDLRRPRTTYMISKIYGEAACHHAGVPYTIVRPHNVYGPRMGLSHVVPELLKKAHEEPDGGVLPVYSVNHRRTFCYVGDAVEVLSRVLESERCVDETLNLGAPGPEISIERLAELILETVGKTMRIEPLADTPGSPTRRRADMSKTLGLIGFEPEVSIEEGLELTYGWYRTNVFEGAGVSAR
jgi:nucleoside-diphosphate-sugar epimerase